MDSCFRTAFGTSATRSAIFGNFVTNSFQLCFLQAESHLLSDKAPLYKTFRYLPHSKRRFSGWAMPLFTMSRYSCTIINLVAIFGTFVFKLPPICPVVLFVWDVEPFGRPRPRLPFCTCDIMAIFSTKFDDGIFSATFCLCGSWARLTVKWVGAALFVRCRFRGGIDLISSISSGEICLVVAVVSWSCGVVRIDAEWHKHDISFAWQDVLAKLLPDMYKWYTNDNIINLYIYIYIIQNPYIYI